jgi:outer membrane protein OmpA-like peptidoglycan-associated protein/Tfp pilus assembly protein PilF
MLKSFFLTTFLLLSCLVSAQQAGRKVSPVAKKKLEKAKEAWIRLDYESAKVLSDKLIEQYPDWTESWKIYAQVYRDAGDQAKNETALLKIVALDSTGYPIAFRWLAEQMFNRGEYSAAASYYDKYTRLVTDTNGIPSRAKLLKVSINFALDQMRNEPAQMPKKLTGPINTSDDEYFPSLSIDGSTLVFTRQARVAALNGHTSQEELFYSIWKDTCYEVPKAFPNPINTGRNEGTQSLSQDGRIMFFTACSRPDSKGGCDLYYCVKSGDSWSDPINIGNPINTGHWESTPFLAQDSKNLYFSSNRPGGYGGMDIWRSTLQPDRSWSNPQNMGPIINSVRDEMSPVLLVDGKTLFFASNGHVGMGGFDLYKGDLTDISETSSLINLGYGINTFHDEDAITINAHSSSGLFMSDRDSLTGKDIYQANLSNFIKIYSVLTISGIVRDRITKLPVSAKIDIQPHGDSLVSSVEADPSTGNFLLGIPERQAYRIGASANGYLPYSQYFIRDSTSNLNKISHSIDLEPIKEGASIVLQNTFFELNSYEILKESYKDMEEILSVFIQNPGIVIEISGYTDNTGTDDHNLILSQKRAESVMKYLVNRGIDPRQLTSKGYGKSIPIANNETEEGRRLNRRTEMRVIRLK